MSSLNKSVDTSKIAGVILAILIIFGVGIYFYNVNSQNGTTVYTPSQQTISELQSITSPQTDIKVGKTSEATDDYGYKHIYVDISNTGELKTGVSITATLYDANNTVIGTVLGLVQNLSKGETKTSDIIVSDSKQKTYTRYKVDVNGSY